MDRDGHLMYVIRNGVVEISTRQDFSDEVYTRVYDIAAQIHPVPGRDEGAFGASGGHRPTGERMRSEQPAPRRGSTCLRNAKADQLIEVIKSLRPESWADNGGPGRIIRYGDKLIITQTIELHEMIGGTFRDRARQKRQRPPAPQGDRCKPPIDQRSGLSDEARTDKSSARRKTAAASRGSEPVEATSSNKKASSTRD